MRGALVRFVALCGLCWESGMSKGFHHGAQDLLDQSLEAPRALLGNQVGG
jgi:hypothetical protein